MQEVKLRLEQPNSTHKSEWIETVKEFRATDVQIVPYGLHMNCSDYNDFMRVTEQFHTSTNIPSHLMSASTYFLMQGERIVGAVNIRHRLNDNLLHIGGHIGYGIRPSERQKGYAPVMLRLALDICKDMGIENVLVCCNENNIASARTIERCGGIMENQVMNEATGLRVNRYWI